jgi:hypothetical protein
MSEQCAYCAASFASPAELIVHLRKARHGAGPSAGLEANPASRAGARFPCLLCGKEFLTSEALASHALRPHRTLRPARPALA